MHYHPNKTTIDCSAKINKLISRAFYKTHTSLGKAQVLNILCITYRCTILFSWILQFCYCVQNREAMLVFQQAGTC